MTQFEPAYIKSCKNGLIKEKIDKAYKILSNCVLCPRKCKINRLTGQTGLCKTGRQARVVTYLPHFGEEAPLIGKKGSGTIFFSYCSLLCNFCQNYHVSHEGYGEDVSDTEIAEMMIFLQNRGCHNINFVTPSHVVPQILSAVAKAAEKGLSIPLVYDSSAYDCIETLRLLENIFDIYMPDFKFWDPKIAKLTCNAQDYPEKARKSVIEMHRQVGDLLIDKSGLAKRGLMIRHLVMPGGLAGTRQVMRFIAQKISPDTFINIMPQYRPCGKAIGIDKLFQHLSQKEYKTALAEARQEGLRRIYKPEHVFQDPP